MGSVPLGLLPTAERQLGDPHLRAEVTRRGPARRLLQDRRDLPDGIANCQTAPQGSRSDCTDIRRTLKQQALSKPRDSSGPFRPTGATQCQRLLPAVRPAKDICSRRSHDAQRERHLPAPSYRRGRGRLGTARQPPRTASYTSRENIASICIVLSSARVYIATSTLGDRSPAGDATDRGFAIPSIRIRLSAH